MDRYCEYCVNLRSVVYCKADAAYLCLSCDTKVHSANPLSKRHHRTLICDTCKRRPSYVHCYDHQKFMCRSCDLNQHNAPSRHRRRVINSYMGSPSAQELGVLWGFDLNQLLDDSIALNNKFGSSSSASANKSVIGLETNVHDKETRGGIKAWSVFQQLVDLLRAQTSELDSISSVIHCCQEHPVENTPDQFSQQLVLGGECLDRQDMSLDSCSSPFAHLDHLESETDETDLPGDFFWQCKSPVMSDQIWSQNLQDLGVCEEPFCFDDVNMPDIDLTFRNFEELFRIEQEPTKIDQDTSMATTSLTKVESCTKKARHASQVMSFSHSRVGAKSNGTLSIGSSISPSSGSMEHQEPLKLKERKNVQTKDPRQGQSGFRKARSDPRKRIKSQNWRFERHEPVTRSF